MDRKFLGVPLVVWGTLCIVLTIVWSIFWPHQKAATTTGLRFVILRWFHALVWLLLAIAAFLAAIDGLGGPALARTVAFLSLIAYLVFLVTLNTTS
ncbi:MAG: hypothetical protein IPO81_06715 [Kouleothrix sp.]|nr:hypothetical protein [Kouleothrix sp.]